MVISLWRKLAVRLRCEIHEKGRNFVHDQRKLMPCSVASLSPTDSDRACLRLSSPANCKQHGTFQNKAGLGEQFPLGRGSVDTVPRLA
jgi:hypothetical protein